ncbi:sensor histidine kinase [Heliophilum fasciatum]|uniref:histidine kinase n=1 Tax=Heliophilum fasciatum TaxID=35700 RepID=A0A4R2S8B0_9FIRM|nr:ATP-binding protein [Heliophilum fasciatum]MCW2276889.1 two-component system sensor histidine kinase BaeS [Heliophilum fasciatum]TCP68651.1 two-component system sensor histidine kinase BaeS [Heliophilum fasciatum]
MRLQSKLLLGSFLIIFTLSSVYLMLSLRATDMVFERFEGFVQKQMAEQMQDALIDYYLENGESWAGVQQYRFSPPRPRGRPDRITMALFDQQHQLITTWPAIPPGNDLDINFFARFGVQVPLLVDDHPIGTLWLPSHNPIFIDGIRAKLSVSLINNFLISILLSSAIAIALSYFLANRLTHPLKQLAVAAGEIKKRRFDRRLPVTSGDEIGTVITAFNEMSEELQRGEQVRKNMVADVAHELRTPLTIMEGQLESIQQGLIPATVETVSPIYDEVIRLTRLVGDLRQLTLAEAGQLPLRLMPTDAAAVIQRIVETFAFEAEAQNVTITLHSQDRHSTLDVVADPDRLTQIIVNIVGNALTYSPVGSTIIVGVAQVTLPAGAASSWLDTWLQTHVLDEAPSKDTSLAPSTDATASPGHPSPSVPGIIVWIADEGPGIAPEHLPFVFERFYRGDPSRSRESYAPGGNSENPSVPLTQSPDAAFSDPFQDHPSPAGGTIGGTGLGLAIAREFVLAHGGQITAVNRPEKGSCFAFYLPSRPTDAS